MMKKNKTATHTFLWPLIIWIMIVILWGVFRYFFMMSEVIEEMIIKPIFFVGPVCIYLYFKKQFSLETLGFRHNGIRSIIFWGVGFGSLMVVVNLAVWLGRGQPFVTQLPFIFIVIQIIVTLATSISEEILYRGFLMDRLWTGLKNPYLANIVTALLFCIGHAGIAVFIYGYIGLGMIMYLWIIFILGLSQGLIYQHTRSIWATIIAHALWNLSNIILT